MKNVVGMMIVLFFTVMPMGFGADCEKVTIVSPNSSTARGLEKTLLRYINRYQKDRPQKIKFGKVLQQNNWFVAEVEPSDLEPGIFVLKLSHGTYRVVTAFGGSTAPDEPGPIIRQYLRKQAPAAPKELFECYSPTPETFGF